jgi:hypothetical protein
LIEILNAYARVVNAPGLSRSGRFDTQIAWAET